MIWTVCWICWIVIAISSHKIKADVYTKCGGRLNGTHGYIQTPNFPRPFPVPIRCQWIIEAPVGKQTIIVYMTQMYLRGGLVATDYGWFNSETDYMKKGYSSDPSFDNFRTNVTVKAPVLVLDLSIKEMANMNMRVMDHFLDVYGFNITYEIVDEKSGLRTDACSIFKCSFNGNCYAGPGFKNFSCQCFPGFFGEKCQYGTNCNLNKSLCGNGQRCSYTIGSEVFKCECPPGFVGDDCVNEACLKLNCSQRCVQSQTSSKKYTCACLSGYKLTSDKKTCLSSARVRFVGSITLQEPRFDPSTANKSSVHYIELKESITKGLEALFKRQLQDVHNLTITNFLPGGKVEFHFFGRASDKDTATKIYTNAVGSGHINPIAVRNDSIHFEFEPALNLQELWAKPGQIRKQGEDISLGCLAKGTSHLQFQWFRNGVPIDMDTSDGHVWLKTIPKNPKDQYTGVIMIDKLVPEDQGVFTCQVTDWGEVQRRNISIRVLKPSRVNLKPLATTLFENETLKLLCLGEWVANEFAYSWLKDNKPVNPSAGLEFVEDIFPTGSRITITKATASAVYTCIISNRAGQMKRDSHVTVIHSDYPTCHSEEFFNLTWNTTAVHTRDIQRCPPSYIGKAHRTCSLVHRVPFWEEPDFSECTSPSISTVLNHFQYMKLGYMVTNVTTLLRTTLRFLSSRYPRLYPGEGKPILDLLHDIFLYEAKYPPPSKALQLENLRLMMDIADFLLNSTRGINSAQHAIQLEMQVENQAKSLARLMGVNKSRSEVKHSFVVEVIKVPTSEFQTFNFPSNNSLFPWLNDFLKLTLQTKDAVPNLLKENVTTEIAVIFYKNLAQFLPKRYLAKYKGGFNVEYMVGSSIVSLSGAVGMEQDARNWNVQVTIKFDTIDANLRSNVDANYGGWYMNCGMADIVSDSRVLKPQWTLSACSLTKDGNYTFCTCDRFGTYALLLTNFQSNQTKTDNFVLNFDCLVAVCCVVCLFLIFLTAVVLIICCRKIPQGVLILKLQICIGFAGTVASFLTASRSSLREEWYPFIATALQFFFLLPYSTQACLELMVYLEIIHSYQTQNVQTKIILISWGIPFLVTGATLAAQSQTGFQFETWWIQIGDFYFYGFIITAIVLILLYMTVYLIVSAELRHVKMDKSHKGKIVIRSGRVLPHSLVVQLFLITLTVSAILYINIPQLSMKYFFCASIVITGVVVFLLYGIGDCICTYCCCEGEFATDEISPEPQALTITKFDPAEECLMENNISDSVMISNRRGRTKRVLQLTEGKMLPDVTSNQSSQMSQKEKRDEPIDEQCGSHFETIPLTCVHDTSHLASTSSEEKTKNDTVRDKEHHMQCSSLVNYKASPKKILTPQLPPEFRSRTFGSLGTLLESPLEEELPSSIKKKAPPPVKPKPGKCLLAESTSGGSQSKSHKPNTSHRVTFGPVFNVPLEREENYCGKVTLPPPLRFKDPAPSLLKTHRLLPPSHLKLDGILATLGSRDLSCGNSPDEQAVDEDSECPSREVSSPDSHDTAV